jgi:hypothetical protein
MSLDSAEKTLASCRVISFASSEWRADAFVVIFRIGAYRII